MIIEISSLDTELKNNIEETIETSKYAVSPYYGYNVCTMFVDEFGNKYKGVNFEPTNGKSICSETGALSVYLLSDKRKLKYIIVYGSAQEKEKRNDTFCFPCGSCRQMLNDFIDKETIIYAVNETGKKVNKISLSELLPFAYDKNNLNV